MLVSRIVMVLYLTLNSTPENNYKLAHLGSTGPILSFTKMLTYHMNYETENNV